VILLLLNYLAKTRAQKGNHMLTINQQCFDVSLNCIDTVLYIGHICE